VQINNRQQLLTILAVAALVLFAGDSLLLKPMVAAWKARAAQVTSLRKDIEQGKSLLEREQTIRSRWEALRRSTLPSNRSTAEQTVFKAVDRWAQDSRVSITAITPQWKRGDDDDFTLLQCRVDASGNLGSLSRLIYNIEADPMALKLESVELGARDKDGQQLPLALQVSGLVLNAQEK